jgi:hypothetical protein
MVVECVAEATLRGGGDVGPATLPGFESTVGRIRTTCDLPLPDFRRGTMLGVGHPPTVTLMS